MMVIEVGTMEGEIGGGMWNLEKDQDVVAVDAIMVVVEVVMEVGGITMKPINVQESRMALNTMKTIIKKRMEVSIHSMKVTKVTRAMADTMNSIMIMVTGRHGIIVDTTMIHTIGVYGHMGESTLETRTYEGA